MSYPACRIRTALSPIQASLLVQFVGTGYCTLIGQQTGKNLKLMAQLTDSIYLSNFGILIVIAVFLFAQLYHLDFFQTDVKVTGFRFLRAIRL